MKALVTGGAGFIGHHLVRRLLENGHDVVVLDNFATGDIARLDPWIDAIRLLQGSILDPDALDEAAEGCEVIFHEAAIPSVARSVHDPHLTNTVNVRGTIEVMLAARRQGVRRVVFAGSSSVYGVTESLPCRETHVPHPESPYGVSKIAGEYYIKSLGQLNGTETAILRRFNVFGPGQDPQSDYAAVVPKFVTAVLNGTRPTINGTGEVSRDFTYVDNVVEAALLAARPDAPSSVTANVAGGGRHTLLQLLDAIGEAAGRRVEPIFGPPRPGDILHSEADITLARKAFGYEVVVPFAEGVRRTVSWYQEAAHRGRVIELAPAVRPLVPVMAQGEVKKALADADALAHLTG